MASQNEKPLDDASVNAAHADEGQTHTSYAHIPAPRLPHERDESSDSQTSAPQPIMVQALKDLEGGLVDTDRGPPMDSLYESQVRTGSTPDRGAPATTTDASAAEPAKTTVAERPVPPPYQSTQPADASAVPELSRESPPDTDRTEKVRQRAHALAEQRNFAPGHELDDWLQAERSIDGR